MSTREELDLAHRRLRMIISATLGAVFVLGALFLLFALVFGAEQTAFFFFCDGFSIPVAVGLIIGGRHLLLEELAESPVDAEFIAMIGFFGVLILGLLGFLIVYGVLGLIGNLSLS